MEGYSKTMSSYVKKPWGYYVNLHNGVSKLNNFKYLVKIIVVSPGGVLSLQSHQNRDEIWIIREGILSFYGLNNEFYGDMGVGEFLFVPAKDIHRIANNQATPLALMEIQMGPILDENDITRYEDKYDRS